MPFDPDCAALFRADLAGLSGVSEKKMFGGIAWFLHGNMLGGVHNDGGMYRVGKERVPEALEIPGGAPMVLGKRTMGAFVDVQGAAFRDGDKRAQWLEMALANARSLPPKA